MPVNGGERSTPGSIVGVQVTCADGDCVDIDEHLVTLGWVDEQFFDDERRTELAADRCLHRERSVGPGTHAHPLTAFTSRNSSKPQVPPSRPFPDWR